MLAFVLSGGANRGPLEVGALQVLLERGVVPDMLVGTSAGAINAAFLAIDPSPDTARHLGRMWLAAHADGVFRGHRLTMLWRFVTGKDSLYSNEGLRSYVERSLPLGKERFADVQAVRLFIVATRLDTGEARVFGHDPQERLLDAIMASTALPPFFPPWACGDELLIDGGISADLPVRIAIAEGAREIYGLHLVDAPQEGRQIRGAQHRRAGHQHRTLPPVTDGATGIGEHQGRDAALCSPHGILWLSSLGLEPCPGDDRRR